MRLDRKAELAEFVKQNTYSWRDVHQVIMRLGMEGADRYYNKMFKKYGYKNRALYDEEYTKGKR